MKLSRRGFLAGTGAGLASLAAFPRLSKADSELSGTPRYFFEPGEYKRIDSERRRFHLCAYYDEIFYAPTPGKELDKRVDPDYPIELPVIWKDAGVTDIWFTHYVQGSWFQDWDSFDKMADRSNRWG